MEWRPTDDDLFSVLRVFLSCGAVSIARQRGSVVWAHGVYRLWSVRPFCLISGNKKSRSVLFVVSVLFGEVVSSSLIS